MNVARPVRRVLANHEIPGTGEVRAAECREREVVSISRGITGEGRDSIDGNASALGRAGERRVRDVPGTGLVDEGEHIRTRRGSRLAVHGEGARRGIGQIHGTGRSKRVRRVAVEVGLEGSTVEGERSNRERAHAAERAARDGSTRVHGRGSAEGAGAAEGSRGVHRNGPSGERVVAVHEQRTGVHSGGAGVGTRAGESLRASTGLQERERDANHIGDRAIEGGGVRTEFEERSRVRAGDRTEAGEATEAGRVGGGLCRDPGEGEGCAHVYDEVAGRIEAATRGLTLKFERAAFDRRVTGVRERGKPREGADANDAHVALHHGAGATDAAPAEVAGQSGRCGEPDDGVIAERDRGAEALADEVAVVPQFEDAVLNGRRAGVDDTRSAQRDRAGTDLIDGARSTDPACDIERSRSIEDDIGVVDDGAGARGARGTARSDLQRARVHGRGAGISVGIAQGECAGPLLDQTSAVGDRAGDGRVGSVAHGESGGSHDLDFGSDRTGEAVDRDGPRNVRPGDAHDSRSQHAHRLRIGSAVHDRGAAIRHGGQAEIDGLEGVNPEGGRLVARRAEVRVRDELTERLGEAVVHVHGGRRAVLDEDEFVSVAAVVEEPVDVVSDRHRRALHEATVGRDRVRTVVGDQRGDLVHGHERRRVGSAEREGRPAEIDGPGHDDPVVVASQTGRRGGRVDFEQNGTARREVAADVQGAGAVPRRDGSGTADIPGDRPVAADDARCRDDEIGSDRPVHEQRAGVHVRLAGIGIGTGERKRSRAEFGQRGTRAVHRAQQSAGGSRHDHGQPVGRGDRPSQCGVQVRGAQRRGTAVGRYGSRANVAGGRDREIAIGTARDHVRGDRGAPGVDADEPVGRRHVRQGRAVGLVDPDAGIAGRRRVCSRGHDRVGGCVDVGREWMADVHAGVESHHVRTDPRRVVPVVDERTGHRVERRVAGRRRNGHDRNVTERSDDRGVPPGTARGHIRRGRGTPRGDAN